MVAGTCTCGGWYSTRDGIHVCDRNCADPEGPAKRKRRCKAEIDTIDSAIIQEGRAQANAQRHRGRASQPARSRAQGRLGRL
eukprot:1106311-Alexandrium_andersonii.AAC.1